MTTEQFDLHIGVLRQIREMLEWQSNAMVIFRQLALWVVFLVGCVAGAEVAD